MSENEKMNSEKRSLSVDDILAEARERRAKRLALEENAVLPKEEIKEEISETEEIVEETPQVLEEAVIEEPVEEEEEADELTLADNIEDEEALKDLALSDGAEKVSEESETVITEITEEKEDKKKKIAEILYEWVGEVIIAVAIVAVFFSFFFRVVTVFGASMEPNFYGEDKLIVSSFLHKIDVGDVVVAVDVLDTPIIKRVIAKGGQTVDIDNETGTVYVDGKALDESAYIENGITFSNGADKISFPLTVKEGHYFLLGDNRIVSQDSRFASVGEVSEDKILGEVKARFFPFSKFKLYF